VLAVSMVVQIGEELLVSGKLLLEPRALLLRQLLGHHGGPVAVNLAHSSRIPVFGRPMGRRARRRAMNIRGGTEGHPTAPARAHHAESGARHGGVCLSPFRSGVNVLGGTGGSGGRCRRVSATSLRRTRDADGLAG